MKKWMRAALTMLLSLMVLIACSQQSGPEERSAAPGRSPEVAIAQPQPAAPADQPEVVDSRSEEAAELGTEIKGTVVNTEGGIIIFSDNGNYVVEGQDLGGLVGKNVQVTGTVEEIEGRSVVTVSSVLVIE